MGFGKWKEIIPSDKSKQFEEGQKVSKNKKEKTVISYEKLLSMYQLKDPSLD